jgi:hypothetical protein
MIVNTVGHCCFTDRRKVFCNFAAALRRSDPSQGYMEVVESSGMPAYIPLAPHRRGRWDSNLQNEVICKLSIYAY